MLNGQGSGLIDYGVIGRGKSFEELFSAPKSTLLCNSIGCTLFQGQLEDCVRLLQRQTQDPSLVKLRSQGLATATMLRINIPSLHLLGLKLEVSLAGTDTIPGS